MRLFQWEGSRQHDRTPTKIASALENFPATVIMASAWPDWSKFQYFRSWHDPAEIRTTRTTTYQTWSERSNHYATRPVYRDKRITIIRLWWPSQWLVAHGHHLAVTIYLLVAPSSGRHRSNPNSTKFATARIRSNPSPIQCSSLPTVIAIVSLQ